MSGYYSWNFKWHFDMSLYYSHYNNGLKKGQFGPWVHSSICHISDTQFHLSSVGMMHVTKALLISSRRSQHPPPLVECMKNILQNMLSYFGGQRLERKYIFCVIILLCAKILSNSSFFIFLAKLSIVFLWTGKTILKPFTLTWPFFTNTQKCT